MAYYVLCPQRQHAAGMAVYDTCVTTSLSGLHKPRNPDFIVNCTCMVVILGYYLSAWQWDGRYDISPRRRTGKPYA